MFNIFTFLKDVKDYFFNLLSAGFSVPLPGATGAIIHRNRLDEQNTSKSKRVMRKERGHQPELIGSRRLLRAEMRALKRRNSFCNNYQEISRHGIA